MERDEVAELVQEESVPRIKQSLRPFVISFLIAGVLAGAGTLWAAETTKQAVLSLATGVVASTLVGLWFWVLQLKIEAFTHDESERMVALIRATIRDEEE